MVTNYDLKLRSQMTVSNYGHKLRSKITVSNYNLKLRCQIAAPNSYLKLRYIISRYGWAIIPKNILGASCSFFLALTGLIQGYRRYHYDTYIKGTPQDDKLNK